MVLLSISILLTVAGGMLLENAGVDARTAADEGAVEKLTVHVSSMQNGYLKSEPIALVFGLSNETQAPIAMRGMFMLSPDVSLVSNCGGQELRYQGDSPGLIGIRWRTVEPGYRSESHVVLDPEISERIFPAAGNYKLRIEFSYSSDPASDARMLVVSEPITLQITEPLGIDREAYDYIRTTLRPILLRAREAETFEARRRFSQLFGASSYGKYNSRELALLYEKAGEYQLAEDELYPISDVDFYLREDIDRMLNRLAGKLRKPNVRTKFRRQTGPPPVGVPIPLPPDMHPVVTHGLPPDMQPIRITPSPTPRPK